MVNWYKLKHTYIYTNTFKQAAATVLYKKNKIAEEKTKQRGLKRINMYRKYKN